MTWIQADKPKTVQEIIEELRQYPMDAIAYAYEGEVTGIVIVANNKDRDELGVIHTVPS